MISNSWKDYQRPNMPTVCYLLSQFYLKLYLLTYNSDSSSSDIKWTSTLLETSVSSEPLLYWKQSVYAAFAFAVFLKV